MADGHTRQDGGRCLALGLAGTGCLLGVGRPGQLGYRDPPSLGEADTPHYPLLCTRHTSAPGQTPPTSPNGLSKGRCVYIMHARIDNR